MIMPKMWRDLYINREDERYVEYQYVWDALEYPLPDWKRVLDVGCADSQLCNCLSQLGYDVYGIDIRPVAHSQGWNFSQEDIRNNHFVNDYFDQILAISTIEHIGLKAYGNTVLDSQGDLKAMFHIKRILRPNGNLILTLPYSDHPNDYWLRYYQKATVRKLIEGFTCLNVVVSHKKGHSWEIYQTRIGVDDVLQDPKGIGVAQGGMPLANICLRLTK